MLHHGIVPHKPSFPKRFLCLVQQGSIVELGHESTSCHLVSIKPASFPVKCQFLPPLLSPPPQVDICAVCILILQVSEELECFSCLDSSC